jgi:hypothetical protein
MLSPRRMHVPWRLCCAVDAGALESGSTFRGFLRILNELNIRAEHNPSQVPDVSCLLATGIRPQCDDCHRALRVRPPCPGLPRTDALSNWRFFLALVALVAFLAFLAFAHLGACGPQDRTLPDPRPKPFQQPKSYRVHPNEPPAKSELLRSAHLLHCRYVAVHLSACRQEEKHLYVFMCWQTNSPSISKIRPRRRRRRAPRLHSSRTTRLLKTNRPRKPRQAPRPRSVLRCPTSTTSSLSSQIRCPSVAAAADARPTTTTTTTSVSTRARTASSRSPTRSMASVSASAPTRRRCPYPCPRRRRRACGYLNPHRESARSRPTT